MKLNAKIHFTMEDLEGLVQDQCRSLGYTVLSVELSGGEEGGYDVEVRPMTPEEREEAFGDARAPIEKLQGFLLSQHDELKDFIRDTVANLETRVVAPPQIEYEVKEKEEKTTTATNTSDGWVPVVKPGSEERRLRVQEEINREAEEDLIDPYEGRRDADGYVITQ